MGPSDQPSEIFLLREGRQYGPITAREFSLFIERRELRPTDFVWWSGQPDWVPAPSVVPFPSDLPPPVPPPPRTDQGGRLAGSIQPAAAADRPRKGIDSREAWIIATAALVILAIAFGAPYVVTVALKEIAAEMGGHRSVPSAANSLAWLGTGIGGLAMGLIADKVGVRWTAAFGAIMVAVGLAISSLGEQWQLWLGHALFVGLIGCAGINAPLYVYVTRWFERRRGTALALIASGQYISGAFWPPLFERAIAAWGWRQTMWSFGILVAVTVVPLALIFLKMPPAHAETSGAGAGDATDQGRALGLPKNVTFWLLAVASFLCCIPMAMPQSHLIALCGDLGMLPATGALMLSLLLVCAFISRQLWGALSDRVGGLKTLVLGSAAQATAIAGFLFTQSEAGLFIVSAAFGLGFAGLIPAYVLTARQIFPAREASWRMPMLLLTGMSGMAVGGWSAGLMHDHFGFYAPAFATGLTANLVNFAILATLVLLWRRDRHRTGALQAA